jgi:hypothetical protein
MSIYNSKFAMSAGENVSRLLELTPAQVPNQKAYMFVRSGKVQERKNPGRTYIVLTISPTNIAP